MESRNRILLLARHLGLAALIAATLSMQGCGLFRSKSDLPPLGSEAEEAPGPDASEQPVVDPKITRRSIKTPHIDSSDFELGAFVGVLSIEDFGSNSVVGARLDYHVTESLFLEGTFGRSKGGTTSYERLAGSVPLISDDKRYYTYYALNVGWDVLPGELFIGKNHTYNTALYMTFGLGSTRFAGDNRFTANAGIGYRILFNRFIAAHLDFRDHLFDIDLLGDKKVANNLEGSLGLSVFF